MVEQVMALPAFEDNYVWLLINPDKRLAAVVDPGDGDGDVVSSTLKQLGLELEAILLTHHHQDHMGGVDCLLSQWDCPVYGPKSIKMPCVTHPVFDGDSVCLQVSESSFTVFEVPGHTKEHIAYYGNHRLFCGDTLFAGGCGRLLGGTAEQLYQSLQRLAQLPKTTDIYCAHEYTENNLAFAKTVDPNNVSLHRRIAKVAKRRQKGLSTVPSTLQEELETNPFLRCHDPRVKEQLAQVSGKTLLNEQAVFAAMRELKDGF